VGGQKQDDLKQLDELMQHLTAKERKQLTKALKKLTPDERKQLFEALKNQSAGRSATSPATAHRALKAPPPLPRRLAF
jgi:16S rRNA A1518/A1519 N6-dimethyltransferase RsmA/KsgA/DIM1 with predicted DNA glycosylase/AP lyase activity